VLIQHALVLERLVAPHDGAKEGSSVAVPRLEVLSQVPPLRKGLVAAGDVAAELPSGLDRLLVPRLAGASDATARPDAPLLLSMPTCTRTGAVISVLLLHDHVECRSIRRPSFLLFLVIVVVGLTVVLAVVVGVVQCPRLVLVVLVLFLLLLRDSLPGLPVEGLLTLLWHDHGWFWEVNRKLNSRCIHVWVWGEGEIVPVAKAKMEKS